jgi:hypothetical protein
VPSGAALFFPLAINVDPIDPRLDVVRPDSSTSGYREFEKAAPVGAAFKKRLPP